MPHDFTNGTRKSFMLKYFYKLTLASAALLAASGAFAAEPVLTLSGGNGTKENPYKISNVDDLLELAEACNGEPGSTSTSNLGHYKGKYFILTADLDLTGLGDSFWGIATPGQGRSSATNAGSYRFEGFFDGQNHVIKNWVITGTMIENSSGTGWQTATSSNGYEGVRSNIGFFGAVRNARIENLHIDASCSITGYQNVGAIVGYFDATTYATDSLGYMKNCSNAATIRGYSCVGGLVGKRSGGNMTTRPVVFSHLYNSGRVMCDYTYAGGILGDMLNTRMEYCSNTADVSCSHIDGWFAAAKSQKYAGGLAGGFSSGEINNCFNSGNVLAEAEYAGGLFGTQSGNYATKNSVNIGSAICRNAGLASASLFHGPIGGKLWTSSGKFAEYTNVYFDKQMWGDEAGNNLVFDNMGSTTAQLTSGAALEGLDADEWVFAAGFYPYLKGKNQEAAKAAAGVYLKFPGETSALNFGTEATVSTAEAGITMAMASANSPFAIADGKITIGNVTEITTDTVTLTLGTYKLPVPLMKLPKFWDGEGTAESPYLIKTKGDLVNLAKMVGGDLMEHYAGVYFKQTADIDLASDTVTFLGIGVDRYKISSPYDKYYFSGIYDGDNHTIKNYNVKGVVFDNNGKAQSYSSGSLTGVGLFGALKYGAQVRNVRMVNANLEAYSYCGGIAGAMRDGVNKIENCHYEGNITCYYNYSGGIVGYTYNTVKGDKSLEINDCSFTGTHKVNFSTCGNIAGANYAMVNRCANYGELRCEKFNAAASNTTSQKCVGGIAGTNYANISDCVNYGSIYAQAGECGGIAGVNYTTNQLGAFTNCLSLGSVLSYDMKTVGAIVGKPSTASAPGQFTHVYYDNQYISYGAVANDAVTGVTGLKTSELISGTAPEGLTADNWTFTAGYYPMPVNTATVDIAKRAASTYMLMNSGSLSKFVSGTIADVMPLTASLTNTEPEGSTAFKLDGRNVTVNAAELSSAVLTLANGTYERKLDLKAMPKVLPGSGTEADPYIIASVEDFNKVGEYNQNADQDFAGEYFKVTSDLDFTGKTLTRIGQSGLFFKGIIDGQNHTVKNLTLQGAGGQGFIFGTGAGSVIKNLKFSGCTLTTTGQTNGLVVVKMDGTLENVHVDATCSSTQTGNKEIGGLVGAISPTSRIVNCSNAGSVTGLINVGGIFGVFSGTSLGAEVRDCVNSGKITSTQKSQNQGTTTVYPETYTAGIGSTFAGKMVNCLNTGEIYVETTRNGAGIVCETKVAGTLIDSCINRGTVDVAYEIAAGIVVKGYVGGPQAHCVVSNCANYGDVKSMTRYGTSSSYANTGGKVAGIIYQQQSYSDCINCVNYADIKTRGSNVGGIAGTTGSMESSFINCRNEGNITSAWMVGGIVGYAQQGTKIISCVNTGNIMPYDDSDKCTCMGGITNSMGSASNPVLIKGCYNTGAISGAYTIGGIAGTPNNMDMDSCYNAGVVVALGSINSSGERVEPKPEQSAGNLIGRMNYTNTVHVNIRGCYWLNTLQSLPVDNPQAADGAAEGVQVFENMKALTPAELFDSSNLFGNDLFVYNPFCLPMVKGMETIDVIKVNSVYFMLKEGDTMAHLAHSFRLGSLPGVTWTATGNLRIENRGEEIYAKPNGEGQATLTATCGKYTKSYTFTSTTKVDGVDGNGMKVLDTQYFSTDGVQIVNPEKGSTVIRIEKLSDGTTRTSKVVVR